MSSNCFQLMMSLLFFSQSLDSRLRKIICCQCRQLIARILYRGFGKVSSIESGDNGDKLIIYRLTSTYAYYLYLASTF